MGSKKSPAPAPAPVAAPVAIQQKPVEPIQRTAAGNMVARDRAAENQSAELLATEEQKKAAGSSLMA